MSAAFTMGGRGAAAPEAVEERIARSMAWHALLVAPPLLIGMTLWRGLDGLPSAAFGLALVVSNVLAAARICAWAARISPAALYGAALGGYVVRLAVITAAVLAVHGAPWVDVVALGFSIVLAQLGLLVWEVRSLSHSVEGGA